MFEGTIATFTDYRKLLESRTSREEFNRPASLEVERRLKDLDFLLDEVRSREAVCRDGGRQVAEAARQLAELEEQGQSWSDDWGPNPEQEAMRSHAANRPLVAQIRIFTEAFYLFAWRVREIVSNKPVLLPGLGHMKAKSVSRVRNLLLEHYTQDHRLVVTSFQSVGPNGPVIEPGRQVGLPPPYEDPGLYVNAEEFRDELDRRIARAIKLYANRPVLVGSSKPDSDSAIVQVGG